MSSQFTPKKHSCLKDGVTRQELMDTLDQIKLLKLKTSAQVAEFEKTIEEQSEQICYLSNRIGRADRQAEEAVQAKQQQSRQHEEELAHKDDEIEELKSEIGKLKDNLASSNQTIEALEVNLQQSKQTIESRGQQLAQLKRQFIELGNSLGVGLTQSSESDEALLASVREHGGLRGLLDKMKEEKLRSLEQKHSLNDTVRRLEFQLHNISNEKDFDDKVIAIRTKEVSGLEETIAMLKENVAIHQTHIAELEKRLDSKAIEHTLLNEELALVESKLRSSSHAKEQILRELDELKQQLADKQHDISALTHQNTVLSKRSEYQELVGSVIDESEDYRRINSSLTEFSKFRVEYYRNVDKIQFLCELLDS